MNRLNKCTGLWLLMVAAVMASLSWNAYAEKKSSAETPKKTKAAAPKKTKKVVKQEVAAPNPWVLRPRYTFTTGNCSLDFDEFFGEWRICEVSNNPAGNTIAQGTTASITFGDGTVLNAEALGKGETIRDVFSSPIGDGTHYALHFPPKDGLEVVERVSTFKTWNFIFFSLTVANKGEKPIEIKELSPWALSPNGLVGWGADTKVVPHHWISSAGFAGYDPSQPAAMTQFVEPTRGFCVTVGMLAQGRQSSSAAFQASGGSWQGQAICRFSPPITLAPGETLESDPVWISIGMTPAEADFKYVWTFGKTGSPQIPWDVFRKAGSWAAVEDTGDMNALLRATQLATSMGVKHALIPASWEGRPGSLEGAAPRFPKSMAHAAKSLRDAGVIPGITVDVLTAEKPQGEWSAQSTDGKTWVNIAKPDGRAYAEKRMKKVAEWGFGFLVVGNTMAPDEVLKSFNITRSEANRLAFEILATAGGGLPVFPEAPPACKSDADTWLAAAAATARLGQGQIPIAPIRLNVEGLTALPDEGIALRFCPGPLELIGAPASAGRNALGKVLSASRLNAEPIDLENAAPRLWRMGMRSANIDYPGAAIISLPGAPEWTLEKIKPEAGKEYLLWNGATGQIVDAAQPMRPGSTIESHGVFSPGAAPMFLGITNDIALGIDRISALKWDETKQTLSGAIRGPLAGANQKACIYVPEPWQLDSGKSGAKNIRKGEWAGRILSFELEGDDSAIFDLKFKK